MAPQQTVPTVSLQGILVPQTSIRPEDFFRQTQRLSVRQATGTFPGYGLTDNVTILQTGIISMLRIKFTGTVTTVDGSGAVATKAAWPYNLLKRVKFSANGPSNLSNVSGWHLKARSFMQRADTNDRGVARGIGGTGAGTSRTQGTLSLANESWGVGQGTGTIADGTYDVDLYWEVPVSFDQLFLHGAIFAQTSSTDLNLELTWANESDLWTYTNDAASTLEGSWVVEAVLYTIPQGPDGSVIVPDLSMFHSIIQNRSTGIGLNSNEVRLAGQGVGRQLMRIWFQTINGSSPAPLAMSDANYGQIGWRFGGNDTPEVFQDGREVALINETLFGSDFATHQGFGILDWSSEHSLRDSIDEGSATELRLFFELDSGLSLSDQALEYTQETMFSGAVGA